MHTTPKSRRGGAYITVLTVTMVLLMIAAMVLTVTAVSRRVSASYSDFVGLFDMAVAGNEQAFFLIRQQRDAHSDVINEQAWQRLMDEVTIGFVYEDGHLFLDQATSTVYERIYKEVAVSSLLDAMDNIPGFTGVHFFYELRWDLSTIIDIGEVIITDSYSAVTRLVPYAHNFRIYTRVHRYIGNTPSVPVFVESVTYWTASGQREILLDAYTIYDMETDGVVFPVVPNVGEDIILILDEFAFTMLESIRLTAPRTSPHPSLRPR